MEFASWLADRHHFVKLRSGRWTRTLGAPQHCKPLKASRCWEQH